jgi:site-specific recombinase XerC
MEEAHTATFNSAQDGGPSDRLAVARRRPHTLPQFFATRQSTSRSAVRAFQELLGHKDVRTTMICTHVVDMNDITREYKKKWELLIQKETV